MAPTPESDLLTSTIVLHPGVGERRTATQWYRYRQEPRKVIGAVELNRLTVQSTSVEAFREVAELCTQVATRMEQMYAETAQTPAGPAEPAGGEEPGR
jgi:hypothetical protein